METFLALGGWRRWHFHKRSLYMYICGCLIGIKLVNAKLSGFRIVYMLTTNLFLLWRAWKEACWKHYSTHLWYVLQVRKANFIGTIYSHSARLFPWEKWHYSWSKYTLSKKTSCSQSLKLYNHWPSKWTNVQPPRQHAKFWEAPQENGFSLHFGSMSPLQGEGCLIVQVSCLCLKEASP